MYIELLNKSNNYNFPFFSSGLLSLPGGSLTFAPRSGAETQLRSGVGSLARHGLHSGQLSPRLYPRHYCNPCFGGHSLDRDQLGRVDRWGLGVRVSRGIGLPRRPIQPSEISQQWQKIVFKNGGKLFSLAALSKS